MSEDIVTQLVPDDNPLIPIANYRIGTVEQTTVTGRDLHAFLGIKKAYAHWITTQIKRGRFVQGRDYEVFALEGINRAGGRPSVNHVFTTDAAKQIGMLSGTERGVEIREYFLACERRMHQLESIPHVELEDPILRDMAQIDRIVDQLLPMDTVRRTIQLHVLKEKHGLDLSVGFTSPAPVSPDPKKCKSIIDLLDKKRYMHPSRLWRTWLVNLDVIYPLASYDAVPELTPAGKEIAFIDWIPGEVGLPKPDIKMDEDAFEQLCRKSLPQGRVYNDNHGW